MLYTVFGDIFMNKKFLKTIITTAIVALLGVLFAMLLRGCFNKTPQPEQPEILPETQQNTPAPQLSYEEQIGVFYKNDISGALGFIEPENKYEYVFLVGPNNKLDADYEPADLTDCGYTRQDGRATQKLRKAAAEALKAFLDEGKQYGVTDVTVTSAYRSYSYQDYLFNMYFERDWKSGKFKTKAECEAYTLSYSTKPGTSEHQSGLCVDMHNLPSAEQSFANEPEAKWLAENCYRFGFILRYPENKTNITGITYEPWHFRFVGRAAATEMHNLGLTLEEYIAYINVDN